MKKLLMTTSILLIISSAHAENWVRVDVLQDGTIMEIDKDSIRKGGGFTSIIVSTGQGEGRMYLDCKGHFGPDPNNMRRLPVGSVGWAVALEVCE